MYKLFTILKLQKSPSTKDELSIARGTKTLDSATTDQYLLELEKATNSLDQMFQIQVTKNAVSYLIFELAGDVSSS